MATYSSILAWKIPWTEKPVRQQSGYSLFGVAKSQIKLCTQTHTHIHRRPCEMRNRGSLSTLEYVRERILPRSSRRKVTLQTS